MRLDGDRHDDNILREREIFGDVNGLIIFKFASSHLEVVLNPNVVLEANQVHLLATEVKDEGQVEAAEDANERTHRHAVLVLQF
jgi:hypothetical protein